MFSTMPRIGTSVRRNIAMPRRASISARSCGVETITEPASGTDCAMVSCASPVPGGMSTTMMSMSPQATSRSIWVMADITIGPRQIIGVSSSTRKPIDMILRPKASSGRMVLPSITSGFCFRPKSRGIEGP